MKKFKQTVILSVLLVMLNGCSVAQIMTALTVTREVTMCAIGVYKEAINDDCEEEVVIDKEVLDVSK